MRNLLPVWLDVAFVLVTWGAIVWRVAHTGRRGAPQRLTEALVFAALALTMKMGPLYDLLVEITGPVVLRALIHGACLFAVAGVVGLSLESQGGVVRSQAVPALYVGTGVLTAALVAIASAAPIQGGQMESAPPVWTLAYFAIWCVPTLFGLVPVIYQCVVGWSQQRLRMISTAIVLTYTLLIADNFSIFVSVIVKVVTGSDVLLEGREVPNGIVFTVTVCAAAVICAVSVRGSRDEAWLDPVIEMWLDLRRARPDIALGPSSTFDGRAQRLRAVIESVDALAHIAPSVSEAHMKTACDLVPDGPEALRATIAIQEAAAPGTTVTGEPVLGTDTVGQVGAVAQQWRTAKKLRAVGRLENVQQSRSSGDGRLTPKPD